MYKHGFSLLLEKKPLRLSPPVINGVYGRHNRQSIPSISPLRLQKKCQIKKKSVILHFETGGRPLEKSKIKNEQTNKKQSINITKP